MGFHISVPTIKTSSFGVPANGKTAIMFTLTNSQGMQIKVTNYGGIISSILVPDRTGFLEDVVLGFDRIEEYISSSPYFGALIGRYANRIANGKFILDGKEYTLAVNNGANHLHGGLQGFDKVIWEAQIIESENAVAVELSYLSKDMEEGYPGNMQSKVTYSLNNQNQLVISYKATSDKKTIVNLTHHSYFNLSGDLGKSALNHELTIQADRYLPIDEGSIPTGKLLDVYNTPFDFTNAKVVGAEINANNEQLKNGSGYDHCWVFADQASKLKEAAELFDPASGRNMKVYTTEPGLQFYSGNFLKGEKGKSGITYPLRSAICLETQHFPDSPNKPHFPSTVLNANAEFESTTIYEFSTR